MVAHLTERNDELAAPAKLNLVSMAKLEVLLGVHRTHLFELSANSGSFYKPFKKAKPPRPFARDPRPPKIRTIDNPTGRLKEIQRRIHRKLLRPLTLPSYLCGGIPGKTVLDNVLLHLGSRALVTMDIRNFFPSVSNVQIYGVWRRLLNCSPEISGILTRLTTFERHLPQGAPTSTVLANLVLYSVDEPIRMTCASLSVSYSSWVDDLAFSGGNPRQVISGAVEALRCGGFSVAHGKLKIMGPGSPKVLNGILLGKYPGVVKERLGWIRSGIHKLRARKVPREEIPRYIQRLEGQIGHVASIRPEQARKLTAEFEEAKKTGGQSKGSSNDKR